MAKPPIDVAAQALRNLQSRMLNEAPQHMINAAIFEMFEALAKQREADRKEPQT